MNQEPPAFDHMPWDRNRAYRGSRCFVCAHHTRDLAAPLGIVSGSFPACAWHTKPEVMNAYLNLMHAWVDARDSGDQRPSWSSPAPQRVAGAQL